MCTQPYTFPKISTQQYFDLTRVFTTVTETYPIWVLWFLSFSLPFSFFLFFCLSEFIFLVERTSSKLIFDFRKLNAVCLLVGHFFILFVPFLRVQEVCNLASWNLVSYEIIHVFLPVHSSSGAVQVKSQEKQFCYLRFQWEWKRSSLIMASLSHVWV